MTANPAPGGASSDVSEGAEILAMATCGLDTITPAYVVEASHKPVAWCDDPEIARLIKNCLARQPSAPATAQNDAVREALEGLVAAVEKDANENNSISGYTGARLSDAKAALAAIPPAPVEHEGDTICQECRAPNAPWFADNELWNRVIGGPEAIDDPGGVLCPRCFILRAGETLRITHPERRDAAPVEGAEPLAMQIEAALCRDGDRTPGAIWADERGRTQMMIAAEAAIAALCAQAPSQKDKSRG